MTCPWDLNGDGVVDDDDLVIFKLAYESVIGDSNWNPACDFNGDGEVGFDDFVEFSGNYGPCPGVTPPPTEITCNSPTPHYPSGCALLLHYDTYNNGIIDAVGRRLAITHKADGTITEEEYAFINSAWEAVTINALCPGCYTEGPTPPPNMETRTMSLTEGSHTIQISLAGYDTLNATINVSSTGVTCVSVIGGACGGSSLPRVSTSGWTVTTYLKSGAVTSSYATWLNSKGGLSNITLPDIFELKDEFIGLTNKLGFSPTLPQIMECKDAFIGL